MKFVPNALSRVVAKQVLKTQKHSPTILFGVGVVGVVATAVLASKATLRLEETLIEGQEKVKIAEELLADETSSYDQADYDHDMRYIYIRNAMQVCKLYAPAIVVGLGSLASLTSAHHILNKRNAALGIAFATLDRTYKEYRERVREEVGPEKEDLFHKGLVEEEFKAASGKKVKARRRVQTQSSNGSFYSRVFDEKNVNWKGNPGENYLFLSAHEKFANDLLRARGFVFLNDIYDQLGFERTSCGQVVGWVYGGDGDGYIDFGLNPAMPDEDVESFLMGITNTVVLDFNVDGVVYDKI